MRILKYLLGFFVLAIGTLARATPVDEIESLLHYIGGLDGASFVRNGDAYTAKEAEAHLRLKWNQQKKDIATAEDFIRLCGTKSSVSGKVYLIRFKDGHEEEAGRLLTKQLGRLRSKTTAMKNRVSENDLPAPSWTQCRDF